MRYLVWVSALLFALPAGARETLPVPPIPPAHPPLEAAPMPDPNIIRPASDVGPFSVTLDSRINHRAAPDPGVAFGNGAHYSLDADRRWFVLPGVMVHVPLP